MKIKGRIWKYGDNVNTDIIFAGKYFHSALTPEDLAKHAMEDLDPEFGQKVKPGDIVVGGRNFGTGSSREQAITCLKYAGVRAIVVKSAARIYFRNAIAHGVPLFQSKEAVDNIEPKEEITIDLKEGILVCKAGIFHLPKLSQGVMEIIKDGGLIPHLRKRLSREDQTKK
jgi:3-isopropylmalate/(R)-2-methylmalate dehydratase small subunit